MAEWEFAWPAVDAPMPDRIEDRSGGAALRARLRRETRPLHERLDAAFGSLGNGDRDDYARFLRVNEACLGVIEPVLAASPLFRATGWRVEARHARAAADRRALGCRPLEPRSFAIGAPSLAEAVGIAYVLEGSRLGARMILRTLRRAGAGETNPSLPTLFLEGADGPDRFRAFLDMAERLAQGEAEANAAIDAANATFACFLDAARAADRRPAINGAN